MIHFVTNNFRSTPTRLTDNLNDLGYSSRVIKLGDNKKLKTDTNDLAINWGSPQFEMTQPCKTLNNCKKLNKIDLFQRLENTDINIPNYGVNSTPDKYPVLLRNRNGYGGTDIILCNNIDEYYEMGYTRDFWVEFIDKKYEFRVHVFCNDVISITRKVPQNADDEIPIAWNHDFGYSQVSYNNKFVEMALTNIALNLQEYIEYDFYTIDVIADKQGKFYILEINTASGISADTRTDIYTSKIIELLGEQGNDEND